MSSFGTFWIAQAVSRFGDPITLIALAAVTYRATQSALFTALSVVIATLPSALFGLIGGAIADVVGPQRTMVACDVLRCVLIASVPASLTSEYGLLGAYACVFGAGLCSAIYVPGRIALVPTLVTPEHLGSANSRLTSTDRAVEVVGSLAGGYLVSVLDVRAFYVDALTFAVSALLLIRVRAAQIELGRATVRSLLSDVTGGVRFLWASTVLRANTIFSLLAQLALPVVNGLTPVLLIRRFAKGDVDFGAALFGTAEASLAAGAIMAGLMLPEYIDKVRKGRLLVIGFGVYGLLLVLLGLTRTLLPAVVIFFSMGVANVLFLVPNITISQEVTPAHMRARVAGARIALLNLSWLPIIPLSGALADVFDAGLLISVAGVLTLAIAAIGAFIPAIRDVP